MLPPRATSFYSSCLEGFKLLLWLSNDLSPTSSAVLKSTSLCSLYSMTTDYDHSVTISTYTIIMSNWYLYHLLLTCILYKLELQWGYAQDFFIPNIINVLLTCSSYMKLRQILIFSGNTKVKLIFSIQCLFCFCIKAVKLFNKTHSNIAALLFFFSNIWFGRKLSLFTTARGQLIKTYWRIVNENMQQVVYSVLKEKRGTLIFISRICLS